MHLLYSNEVKNSSLFHERFLIEDWWREIKIIYSTFLYIGIDGGTTRVAVDYTHRAPGDVKPEKF